MTTLVTADTGALDIYRKGNNINSTNGQTNITKYIHDTRTEVSDILSGFDEPSNTENSALYTRKNRNKNKKFYAHLVGAIYYEDLDNIPNDRKNFVYKYLRRLIKPIIKKGVMDIHNGRPEKTKTVYTPHGIFENKVINDGIQENKKFVRDYLNYSGNQDEYELNQYFDDKLEEYFGIYETVIAKRIQQDFHNTGIENINQEKIHGIIINIVNEFTFIIQTFSDKLSVVEFEKLFTKEISSTGETTEKKSLKTDNEGVIGLCKGIRVMYEELKDYPHLLDMYKSFVPTGLIIDNGKTRFDYSQLAINIDQHFRDTLLDIADVYKHWLYSEKMEVTDLLKIRVLLDRFVKNIFILKQKDKAFSEININQVANEFLRKEKGEKDKLTQILNTGYEYDTFCELFNVMSDYDFDSNLTHQEIKQDFKSKKFQNLLQHRSNIIKIKKEQNRKITFQEIDHISVEDMDFDTFNKAGPDKRKAYFLKNLLSLQENGQIIGKNFPELYDEFGIETIELINFSIYFGDRFKGYKSKPENVIEDIKKALNLISGESGIDIYTFELNYIYYEQLLVTWYRYNLFIKKYPDTYDQEKVTDEMHKDMFGPKEKILSENQTIDTLNISFRNGGNDNTIHNTSVLDINELIKNKNHRFRKRPINLMDEEQFGIKNLQAETGVKKLLMKDISSFYIPKNNNSTELTAEEIKEHLDGIYSFCTQLLQRKKISDENMDRFANILTDKGIQLDDFQQITKLQKFIKFVQYNFITAKKLSEKSKIEGLALEIAHEKIEKALKEDTSDSKFELGKPKYIKRILEKLISSYSGDVRKMGDLARMRYIGEDLDDCFEKINTLINIIRNDNELNDYIVQGIVEDNIGNISERGPKSTQYRDIKLQLKNKNGILIEVQFIVKEMYQWKELGLPENELYDIYSDKNIKLDQDFVYELERRSDAEGIKIPLFMMNLFSERVNANIEKYGFYPNMIKADLLYKFHRGSSNNKFKEKMAYLESLVYDRQRGKVMSKRTRKEINKLKITA